jgi:hypothetical protein
MNREKDRIIILKQRMYLSALHIYICKDKKKKNHDYAPLTNDSKAVGNSQVSDHSFPLQSKYLNAFDLPEFGSLEIFEDNSSFSTFDRSCPLK